jgi:hypothetical protein
MRASLRITVLSPNQRLTTEYGRDCDALTLVLASPAGEPPSRRLEKTADVHRDVGRQTWCGAPFNRWELSSRAGPPCRQTRIGHTLEQRCRPLRERAMARPIASSPRRCSTRPAPPCRHLPPNPGAMVAPFRRGGHLAPKPLLLISSRSSHRVSSTGAPCIATTSLSPSFSRIR